MKKQLILVLFLQHLAAGQSEPAHSAEQKIHVLEAVTGKGKKPALSLATAIKNQSRQSVGDYARKIVEEERFDLILPLLDYPLEMVRQEVAVALGSAKSREIAYRLRDTFEVADTASMGGTEAHLERVRTKEVILKSLAAITGSDIREGRNSGETISTINQAIRKMSE